MSGRFSRFSWLVGILLIVILVGLAVWGVQFLADRRLAEALEHARTSLPAQVRLTYGAHSVDLGEQTFEVNDARLSENDRVLTVASIEGQGVDISLGLELRSIGTVTMRGGTLVDDSGRKITFDLMSLHDVDPARLEALLKASPHVSLELLQAINGAVRVQGLHAIMPGFMLDVPQATLVREAAPRNRERFTIIADDIDISPEELPVIGYGILPELRNVHLEAALTRSATEPLSVLKMTASAAGFGQIDLSLQIAGVSGTSSAGTIPAVGVSRVTYRDGGFVDQRMTAIANELGISRVDLARRIGDLIAKRIRARGDLLQDAVRQTVAFLTKPGTIAVEIGPDQPVAPLVAISLGLFAPENLAQMLRLKVMAEQ